MTCTSTLFRPHFALIFVIVLFTAVIALETSVLPDRVPVAQSSTSQKTSQSLESLVETFRQSTSGTDGTCATDPQAERTSSFAQQCPADDSTCSAEEQCPAEVWQQVTGAAAKLAPAPAPEAVQSPDQLPPPPGEA